MTGPTKAELARQLQDALGEVAALRELIAAIVECADVPDYAAGGTDAREQRRFRMISRLSAIKFYGGGVGNYPPGCLTNLLLDEAAQPLGYEVYVDQADDVDEHHAVDQAGEAA